MVKADGKDLALLTCAEGKRMKISCVFVDKRGVGGFHTDGAKAFGGKAGVPFVFVFVNREEAVLSCRSFQPFHIGCNAAGKQKNVKFTAFSSEKQCFEHALRVKSERGGCFFGNFTRNTRIKHLVITA